MSPTLPELSTLPRDPPRLSPRPRLMLMLSTPPTVMDSLTPDTLATPDTPTTTLPTTTLPTAPTPTAWDTPPPLLSRPSRPPPSLRPSRPPLWPPWLPLSSTPRLQNSALNDVHGIK